MKQAVSEFLEGETLKPMIGTLMGEPQTENKEDKHEPT
jgi:hypothetical protein